MKTLILLLALASSQVFAAVTEPDRALVERSRNLLVNGGFESSTAGWTGSNLVTTQTAANVGLGSSGGQWSPSAGSQTIQTTAVAIPAGLYGANALGSCMVKTAATSHKLQAYDGTNVLAETTIPASTTYRKVGVNFIMPSSGNIQLRVLSGAATVAYLDDCYLGSASNLTNVSQATMYASITWPAVANCNWSSTSGSMAAYAADADCTIPTGTNLEGQAQAPATKIPAMYLPQLPAGEYVAVMNGGFYSASTTTQDCYFRISDGTNNSADFRVYSSDEIMVPSITSKFKVASPLSGVTLQILSQRVLGSGACNIQNDQASLKISLYRFPSSSELALMPDQVSGVYSGYHDSNCSWSITSTSYAEPSADGTCSLVERQNVNFGSVTTYGSSLPGIVFTPRVAGRYKVCARSRFWSSATGQNVAVELTDGTNQLGEDGAEVLVSSSRQGFNVCGIYNATSVASSTVKLRFKIGSGTLNVSPTTTNSAIDWTIEPAAQNNVAPIILNQVQTSNSGGDNIERVRVASACTSTPCAIASQSGGVSSVSRASTGIYTINFTAGRFSAAPSCAFGIEDGSATEIRSTTAPTTLAVDVRTYNSSFAAVDSGFSAICMGPR